MIRGWRNNPEWVKIRKEEENRRIARAVSRMQFENQIQLMKMFQPDPLPLPLESVLQSECDDDTWNP